MTYHFLALFCLAATFALHWVFIRQERYLSRKFSTPFLLVAFLALTLFLVSRGREVSSCPIGNPYEIITMIVWSSLFFFMLISMMLRVNYLGFFTAGLSAIILAGINIVPGLNYSYDPASIHSSHIIGFHASLAVFSYGLFTIQVLFAGMYLLQFFGITQKRMGQFFSILPSLLQLEKMQVFTLLAGVFVLSISLFVGSFTIFNGTGAIPVYKLGAVSVVWFIYVAILVFYFLKRLVSASFSWACIIAFVLALLALAPIDRARHDSSKQISAHGEMHP